jgi:hypothetical protein
MLHRLPNIKPSIPLHVSVLFILIAVRLIWKVSFPLLLIFAGLYLLCYIVYIVSCRLLNKSPWVQGYHVPLAWIFITMLFLGGLYHFDRAGWLWFKVTGYNATLPEMISDPVDLSPADFAKTHSIFSLDPEDSTKLVLKEGEYTIEKTILIPRGATVVIEPGTILKFAVGRSLISRSPIIACGTEQQPIVLTAKNKWRKWGVVGIIRTGKSVFEQVKFEHGRQARVNNIDFFATLSVIASEVEINNCLFQNLYGKDALNIRYGKVLIQNSTFRNTYKDGIDLDGGEGIISQNRFYNCADEGIDLSENKRIEVFKNEIYDRKGGKIAADYNLDNIISLNTLGYSEESESMTQNPK